MFRVSPVAAPSVPTLSSRGSGTRRGVGTGGDGTQETRGLHTWPGLPPSAGPGTQHRAAKGSLPRRSLPWLPQAGGLQAAVRRREPAPGRVGAGPLWPGLGTAGHMGRVRGGTWAQLWGLYWASPPPLHRHRCPGQSHGTAVLGRALALSAHGAFRGEPGRSECPSGRPRRGQGQLRGSRRHNPPHKQFLIQRCSHCFTAVALLGDRSMVTQPHLVQALHSSVG